MGSILFALSLAMAGCQGETGPQGAPGAPGQQGQPGEQGQPGQPGAPGQDAFFKDIESCAGCHGATLAAKHALASGDAVQVTLGNLNATTGAQTAVPVEVAANGQDLIVRFNVKVNGVNRIDFVQKAAVMRNHNEDAWWYYDATRKAGIRTKLSTAAPGSAPGTWSFVGNGNGNYTATLFGMATVAHATDPGTAFMLSVMGPDEMTATAVAFFPGALQHDAVASQACKDCHGNHVWRGAAHDVTSGQGADACVVCHNRVGAVETRLTGFIPANANTTPPTPETPAVAGTEGTGLMGIVHGVHNSANMVDGTYTWVWPSNGNTTNFKKGFPGNMPNCRTCHQTDAQLAAVAAAPVSWALCISCHDGMNGFPAIAAATAGVLNTHKTFTVTTDCSGCHNAGGARATVSEFHNGLVTERAGLIWNGDDQSVALAKTVNLAITGVTVNGTNLEITWTAKDAGGVALDPCNQDFANGPVLFGAVGSGSSEGCTNTAVGCASNMSVVRAYAQGDDWVNDNVGNPAVTSALSPGQPASSFTLWPAGTTGKTRPAFTTCDATTKVATTIVPGDTTAATRGIVSLQGKAQVRFAANADNVIWVRNQSPTREFAVATGNALTAERRQIVDVKKCNACHVGTLYQHGGNRVDKIELCVMCHNPASSEQNNRVGMGVTAAEAYDGKPGETYDLRTMVHAIHSAGETQVPLMYYRSNGIYFFGAKDASGNLIGAKNWPAEADCVKCVDPEDGPLTHCEVFGSSAPAAGTKEPIRNADGSCGTSTVDATATWRPHRVIEVHYPRALNDCSACHVSANPTLPNPTQAVAVTVDAGASPWNNLLDDSLVGATTQSCTTCHQSADAATQFGIDVHVFGQGWIPTTFENGRQSLLDAAAAPIAP